jgi:GH43 family beta-xylosidase
MKFFQAVGICVFALSSIVRAASFTNPLKQKDGSDPHIAWSGGYYYMMTTTWNDLRITRATTLGGLKTGETRTVWTDSNPDRCCNMWAVSILHIDRWVGLLMIPTLARITLL